VQLLRVPARSTEDEGVRTRRRKKREKEEEKDAGGL
jgi:hypothetical protein